MRKTKGDIELPRYKKKQTHLMNYQTFEKGILDQPPDRQAFLTVLFFSGCRVSEALALTSDDIDCSIDKTVYIQFKRLKGSKQTDPVPLPRVAPFGWLCWAKGDLFKFSRTTAYRIVKRCFPNLYPHYFRMNRITKISEKHGDSFVYSFMGICAQSIDHYRGKVDIGKVGKALREEVG